MNGTRAKPPDLDAIRARADRATPGPWAWFGNTRMNNVYLATTHSGRRFVMTFGRWGMRSAQPLFRSAPGDEGLMVPVSDLAQYEVLNGRTLAESDREPYRHDLNGIANPDADFIAHAREDVPALLAAIERLREIISDAVPALGYHARDFSQRALIAACEITGADPADWTQHPDVLARLLAAQESAE